MFNQCKSTLYTHICSGRVRQLTVVVWHVAVCACVCHTTWHVHSYCADVINCRCCERELAVEMYCVCVCVCADVTSQEVGVCVWCMPHFVLCTVHWLMYCVCVCTGVTPQACVCHSLSHVHWLIQSVKELNVAIVEGCRQVCVAKGAGLRLHSPSVVLLCAKVHLGYCCTYLSFLRTNWCLMDCTVSSCSLGGLPG